MKARRRDLIGRKIVDVQFNRFRARPDSGVDRSIATDPTLILDNGARLRFSVEETEIGEYGVAILIDKKER